MAEPRYFRVKGRVQGVGFRAASQDMAKTLGLRGWVRNCGNGDVELVAAGSDESLARLRDWLSHGPSAARVTAVEEAASDESALPADFATR